MQAVSSAKSTIEKSLEQAASSITISFGNWTTNKGLDFLGVTAHYLDTSLLSLLSVRVPYSLG
jgi:hypothetical protein